MGWIKTTERLPETEGAYRVKRRARGRMPAFEDECEYTPPKEVRPGIWIGHRWQNARGVMITSVVEWYEEGGAAAGGDERG